MLIFYYVIYLPADELELSYSIGVIYCFVVIMHKMLSGTFQIHILIL